METNCSFKIAARLCTTNKDIIDGNVNDLYEEPDKPHDQEPNARRPGHPSELVLVWLGAFLHQVLAVAHKLCQRLKYQCVHVAHLSDLGSPAYTYSSLHFSKLNGTPVSVFPRHSEIDLVDTQTQI